MNRILTAALFPLALCALALSCLDPSFGPLALLLVCARTLYCLQPGLFGLRFDRNCLGTDPAGTKTDGGIQFGSQSVTISAVAYIFEKITVKRGSRRILQTNQFGVPAKKAHVRTLIEGSATIQFPDATAAAPAQHVTIALVPAGGGTAVNFILEEVGEEFDHEGETKCNVTFSEKLN